MTVIYLIGSLRNPSIPGIGNELRKKLNVEVFDDWYAAGPNADDEWQKYEEEKGHNYLEALEGYAAKHVYLFDKHHLDRCDIGILALPAGKSGHLELGYLAGQGKKTYILFDELPTIENNKRWDVMVQFVDGYFETLDQLCERIKKELYK